MVNGYKIIDFHCHIYPEKIAAKAVAGTDAFYCEHSKHLGTPDDLARCSGGIDRVVVHSVATTPAQVGRINEYIAAEAEKNPALIGFGTLHPASDDIEGDVRHLVSLGLHGVKMHPEIQGVRIDDPRCMKIYELCEKHGLVVLLHTGDKRYDMSNPNRLAPLARSHPGLKLVGAHFGGYTIWEEASRLLEDVGSLYVDSSSSLPYLTPDTARDIISRFGADRVLFGTDYPMHDPAEEVGRMLSLGLTDDEYRKIFFDNAAHLLGIR